jgi:thiol-disulfide isomerase/thioredoxin
MSRASVAFGLVAILCSTLKADLKVGDPAPPLKVSKWLKGKPVNLAEGKGKKIYVVEFWATWCGPCRESIPHLSKMAGHFEKNDVTVIGVSVDAEETRDRVEPFVKEKGDRMGYTVALDDGDATNKAYMEAARIEGIPHAFLIAKDGKIAWHGHPMDGLGIKLAELVGDKAYAESAKKAQELEEKVGIAWKGKKWDDFLASVDKLIELQPDESRSQVLKYLVLVSKKKDAAAAAKWGQELVRKLDNAEALNELAWGILTEKEYAGVRDQKLALAAAKKANDVTEGKSWSILDTYARALFETGSQKEAIALEKKAVEAAKKEKAPDDQLEEMQKALESYEKGARPGGGDKEDE